MVFFLGLFLLFWGMGLWKLFSERHIGQGRFKHASTMARGMWGVEPGLGVQSQTPPPKKNVQIFLGGLSGGSLGSFNVKGFPHINPQKCWGECWEECRERAWECWGDCWEQCWEDESRATALFPAVPQSWHSSRHSPQHFWGFELSQSCSRRLRSQLWAPEGLSGTTDCEAPKKTWE